MVDAIIRITTLLVVLVAIANLGHAALVAARLVQRVRERQPESWLQLLLPAWRSPREAVAWLKTWRAILGAPDPIVATVRLDGRAVLARHAQLFAWSETWAMLVVVIAPYAA